MASKPFEIVAECEITQLPMESDFARLGERLEATRRRHPGIVSSAVTPQGVLRGVQYLVTARFVAWAEDSAKAMNAVEALIGDSGFGYRNVLPSGRSLSGGEAPPLRTAAPKPAATAPARAPAERAAPTTKPAAKKMGKRKAPGKKAPVRVAPRFPRKPPRR